MLLGEERSHPLVHIPDGDLDGLLGRSPTQHAVDFVHVDLFHQRVGCLVEVIDRRLSCNVDFESQSVAMLANCQLGLDGHLGQLDS